MNTTTLYSSLLLTAIFMATTTIITTTTTASSSSQQPCKDELTGISPCLPYIASPPNNLSTSPSSECCNLYNSSFVNGNASCLCYLLRQQSMLGFPLNNTRILSLSTVCSTGVGIRNDLDLLCQATPNLPPLEASPESNESPSPSPNPPLESPLPPPSTSPLSMPVNVTTPPVTPMITANASEPKPAPNSGYKLLPSLLAYILWHLFSYGLLYPSHY